MTAPVQDVPAGALAELMERGARTIVEAIDLRERAEELAERINDTWAELDRLVGLDEGDDGLTASTRLSDVCGFGDAYNVLVSVAGRIVHLTGSCGSNLEDLSPDELRERFVAIPHREPGES